MIVFIATYAFEFAFEPFEVNRAEHRFTYAIIVLVHAGNASFLYLFIFFVVGRLVDQDAWKIYQEAIVFLIVLFAIGSNGFLLRPFIYDNPNNTSIHYYIEEVRNTVLVGSLLIYFIILINFYFLRRSNTRKADRFGLPEKEQPATILIPIKAGTKADSFDLNLAELVCVKSDGNYLEFYLERGARIQKELKRLSMNNLLSQLSNHPELVQTHRAFLVNTKKIVTIKGNAGGYQLTLSGLDFDVPVARSRISAFEHSMSPFAAGHK